MNQTIVEEYRIINHPKNNGNYAVSNLGNVKNIKTNNIKLVGPRGTSRFDDAQEYSIGRLVALTFLTIPGVDYSRKKVFHKDGNHFNNHIDNLYWKL